MAAELIDGKQIAEEIRAEIKAEAEKLDPKPGLAAILVGEDPASQVYVRMKGKACEEAGFVSITDRQPAGITQDDLLQLVRRYNAEERYHGVLCQLPLPGHLDESVVINEIDPRKDVDCFHPVNVGKLAIGEPEFLPCTPAGVQELLLRTGNNPEGKHVVIVGRSNIVGKPLMNILVQKAKGANATVTVCHTRTRNLAELVRQGDIVVAAAGRPNTVTADMVRPGAVVIDVGVNRVDDPGKKSGYRLVGDVDFAGVSQVASAITPVPGGVGPMTIAMLLANTLRAYKRQRGLE